MDFFSGLLMVQGVFVMFQNAKLNNFHNIVFGQGVQTVPENDLGFQLVVRQGFV